MPDQSPIIAQPESSVWVQVVPWATCGAWDAVAERMCARNPGRGHAGDWYGGGTIWLCDQHAEQAAEGMIEAADGIVNAMSASVVTDGPLLMSDTALGDYAAEVAAEEERECLRGPQPVEVKVQHVYVIERDRWVKIGKSFDVRKRVKSLSNGGATMPDGMVIGPLELLFTIPHDCEAELHERFAAYRDRGEWFRHEGEVATWTSEMRALPPKG